MRSASTLLSSAFVALGSLVNLGCAPQVGAPLQGSIAGRVVKSAVAASTVTAYAVNGDGRRAKAVGSAVSDDGGAFAVNIAGHFGPTLVCASGGTYLDEATGVVVGLGTGELCALVDDVQLGTDVPGVLLTPFTALHAALTGCFLGSAKETSVISASQRAELRLHDFLGAGLVGFEFRSTVPFDLVSGLAPSLTPEVWYGVLLAGLSESARQISLASDLDPGVRVTPSTLTTELVRDIDDGLCVLDGEGPSGRLSQGDVALSANTLRSAPQGLALSIGAFLDGARNASGVSRSSVTDLTFALSTHESEIFGGDAGGDLDAPTLVFLEPVAGPVAGTPAIRVLAEDASEIVELVFTAPDKLVDAGAVACQPTSADGASCELSGTLNTSLFPVGDVTLSARATDAAGNSADASVVVTINNSIPVIVVSSPTTGTVSGLVDLQASASDPDGLASFTVEVPGTVLASQCAPPLLVDNCDQELDPTIIDVQWDTTTSNEGPLTVTFTATDTAGNPAFAQVQLDVDNVDAGTIAGRVDFGYPVVGATVTAFETADGVRGAAIGTALTDEDGLYQIVNAEFSGVVEVGAVGGSFEDPSTGQTLTLRAGQELAAAVLAVEPGEATVANVNALTTLAARRAHVTLSESASFGAAVTFNSNLFASHVLRPGSLSLVSSGSADLFVETPAPSDSAALMALVHAGLSRVAAQLSIDVGGAPGQVTPVDLLDVLLADLNDGVLDGSDTGVALFLDQQAVPSDSYVLRTTLAVGIDNFVKNAPLRDGGAIVLEAVRNNSGIVSDALAAQDLLYDDLSLNRSVLFPAGDAVIPFDRTPPTVDFLFAAPNDGAVSGDVLTGVVAVIGTAIDPSGLSAFNVLSPDLADLFSPVADVRVEIDGRHEPNEADVLALCGVDVREPPLELLDASRHVCLCVEAVDALENIAHGVHCFTRPLPVVVTDATTFVGPARTSVQATATGSFDLEACAGTISQGESVVGAAVAPASGNTCALVIPVATPFVEGTAKLDVDVTEIGGAVSRSSFNYTVDLVAPSVSITSPGAGSFRSTPPLITATAIDDNLVSVVADVTTNALPVAVDLVGVIGPAGAVTFPAFTDAEPDGLRTITVTATDAAGNTASDQRSYTKDTTAPLLLDLANADGNPLRHFQLTATTAFSPSSQCSTFPFTGCVFNIAANAPSEDVDFRPSAGSVETYRRWQHLAGQLITPSTVANPAVENRAPTLRLKTEASLPVEARIDATCPADAAAFENRARGTFVANAVGLVDIPIADVQSVTSATLLRNQLGSETLCLSMRPTDLAGNKGAIVNHFFRYEATPAPLFFLFNAGAYTPASFAEDVEAFDDGNDDDVLSGSGQGSAGRVFAHAYLVSPSTLTTYNYSYAMSSGAAPRVTVSHREVAQVSRKRAFNWCYTPDGNDSGTSINDADDDLVNPDQIIANEANSAPNNPTWSGSDTDVGSSSASWALFTPTGGNLLGASCVMEHRAVVQDENDTTFSHGPAVSYPTDADTTELGQTFTFAVDLANVTIEVWSANTVTGLPSSVIDSGATVAFTAGGSSASTRHRLLVFRAPVPQNSVTLKTAQVISGQLGTLGFNDACIARNSAGDFVSQMFELNDDHWVVADASLPSGGEPALPRRLFWVKSGAFSECDGTSSHDCRYGRYFDDYIGTSIAWQAGRSVTTQGKVNGVSGAPFVAQPAHTIPPGETRALAQEP